jgi:hypothetical protein
MMVKVLFYSYMTGMMSCRKMWEGLKNRADYIFLSGDQVPDFRTLNRFRLRMVDELANLFGQIVMMCVYLGMTDFGYLAIDGQKIQANANFTKTMNRERWKKKVSRVEKGMKNLLEQEISEEVSEEVKEKRLEKLEKQKRQLEELEKQLGEDEEETSINMSDPDANTMNHKDGRKQPSYNHQSAVDGKLGVTVGVRTQTDAFDRGEHLFPLVDEANRNTGGNYTNVVADSGFCDFKRLEEAEEKREETYYLRDKEYEKKKNKSEKRGKYGRSHFRITDTLEVFCPEGYPMKYHNTQKRNDGEEVLIFEGTQCETCRGKDTCTGSTSGKRRISVDQREKYRRRMQERLKSDHGREMYMRRQGVVEPVQGDDQKNRGWKQHHLRGKAKAAFEFMLIRTATNLRKICDYRAEEVLAWT